MGLRLEAGLAAALALWPVGDPPRRPPECAWVRLADTSPGVQKAIEAAGKGEAVTLSIPAAHEVWYLTRLGDCQKVVGVFADGGGGFQTGVRNSTNLGGR